jgi:hypothetical protein
METYRLITNDAFNQFEFRILQDASSNPLHCRIYVYLLYTEALLTVKEDFVLSIYLPTIYEGFTRR